MKKNIRKKPVLTTDEIVFGLETPELKKSFIQTCQKINDDELVKIFWNLLIEYKKLDKMDLAENLSISSLMSLGAARILYANGNPFTSEVFNAITLSLAVGALLAEHASGVPADEVQVILQEMLVIEPELYDIELAFNGYTREDIDTSKYDGKAKYQKLHDKRERSNQCLQENAQEQDTETETL